MSVMYWMAQESFTKAYYNTDNEVSPSQISIIPEGARVVVNLKTNDDRERFEIETVVYGADGQEIAGCYSLMLLPYTEDYNPETFADGVYVSFGCWMDTRAEFYNEWEIESIGQTGAWEPSQPEDPDDPDDPDNPGTDPSDPSDGPNGCNGGCNGGVFGGSAALSVLVLGTTAVIRKKKRS